MLTSLRIVYQHTNALPSVSRILGNGVHWNGKKSDDYKVMLFGAIDQLGMYLFEIYNKNDNDALRILTLEIDLRRMVDNTSSNITAASSFNLFFVAAGHIRDNVFFSKPTNNFVLFIYIVHHI